MSELQNLKENILNQVKNKKPHSKNYFLGVDIAFAVSIGLIFLSCGLLFGFFLWDSLQTGADFLNVALFEILFAAILLFVILFFLYRQTNFFLVKYQAFSFFIFVLLLAAVSGGLVWASQVVTPIQENFQQFQNGFESLPYRKNRMQNRQKNMQNKLKERDIFLGKVVNIEEKLTIQKIKQAKLLPLPPQEIDNFAIITIENKQEKVSFFIHKKLLALQNNNQGNLTEENLPQNYPQNKAAYENGNLNSSILQKTGAFSINPEKQEIVDIKIR